MVQLHVVEEMLEMMQSSESDTGEDLAGDRAVDCCVLSREALEGGESPTTMRLHGWVQDREVLMLVDSGSSHSFVSAALADHLQGAQASRHPLSVRVVNGGQMRSVQEIPDCPWQTQGVGFHTSFKILPLGCYDAILGIDWLAAHSPMKVHWLQKTMAFEYQGKQVQLRGAQADTSTCQMISEDELNLLLQQSAVARVVQLCSLDAEQSTPPIPDAIAGLVEQYSMVFEEPQGLPPRRSFDHAIPLVPGAKPVNLRPYRHSPAQKDEVERQVAAMLAQGIIQPSTSPFASPVLLV